MTKVLIAKIIKSFMNRDMKDIDEPYAQKWNHLNAIIATNGRVKFDWNKIRMIPVVKCSRCCKVLSKGKYGKELCTECRSKLA